MADQLMDGRLANGKNVVMGIVLRGGRREGEKEHEMEELQQRMNGWAMIRRKIEDKGRKIQT